MHSSHFPRPRACCDQQHHRAFHFLTLKERDYAPVQFQRFGWIDNLLDRFGHLARARDDVSWSSKRCPSRNPGVRSIRTIAIFPRSEAVVLPRSFPCETPRSRVVSIVRSKATPTSQRVDRKTAGVGVESRLSAPRSLRPCQTPHWSRSTNDKASTRATGRF